MLACLNCGEPVFALPVCPASRFPVCVEHSLQKIENILQMQGPARGPFVEGDDLTVGDLTLAVTTYHMQAAFAVEKQW